MNVQLFEVMKQYEGDLILWIFSHEETQETRK